MPALQNATTRHPGLVKLDVDAGEVGDRVQAFTRALGLTFVVVLDPSNDIRNHYSVRVFHTKVWIDAAGIAKARQTD